MMFRQILFAQWKWSRLVLTVAVPAAFALPILSVQQATASLDRAGVTELLQDVGSWGVLYPILAGAAGLAVAMLAWAPDHRGRHVYALSLPVPRAQWVALRFAAGATLLLPVVAGAALGIGLAALTVHVPDGLHVYPVGLTARFGLALYVAYALFFSVSAATPRTAGYILGGLAALVAIEVVLGAAGITAHLASGLVTLAFTWPGPFAVFAGRWMLIDV